MAGWPLGVMPQVCAAAHPKGFANDQCAQMLRPGKHPGTFFDCLIVWALPSIHSIAKPSQPLKIRLDCRPLVPCTSGQVPFAFFSDHFWHDQLHPSTGEVVLER